MEEMIKPNAISSSKWISEFDEFQEGYIKEVLSSLSRLSLSRGKFKYAIIWDKALKNVEG